MRRHVKTSLVVYRDLQPNKGKKIVKGFDVFRSTTSLRSEYREGSYNFSAQAKKEITKSLRIELPETATAPRKRNSHFKPHTDALPQSFWNNNESKTETPAA